jgi:hypothetical protein
MTVAHDELIVLPANEMRFIVCGTAVSDKPYLNGTAERGWLSAYWGL